MPIELPPRPLTSEARSDIELAGFDPELVEPESVEYIWPAWWPRDGGLFGIAFDYTPADGRRRHAEIQFRSAS